MSTNKAFFLDENAESLSITQHDEIQEVDHISDVRSEAPQEEHVNKRQDYIVVLVLFIINLLNYIDRFTVAGVLVQVTKFYNINDKQSGMLQTVFIVVYMIMSPVFGYLGDRTSRKIIVLCGITFWSLITLASSFVPDNMFWLFLLLRSLVGVGEASYSTVAPTIISDMFTGDKRTKVMAFFYFAVPVGSGLGFIVGYGLYIIFDQWQYALRLSPILGLVCVFLLACLVEEPQRGVADGGTHLAASPWMEDILQLTKNRSFILVSLGFTCVCFVIGALSWYSVPFLNSGIDAFNNQEGASKAYKTSFIFGGMTMVAGILGVLIGTETGRRLRKRYKSSDPIVCGVGLILAAPLTVIALLLVKNHFLLSLFVVFLVQTCLCLNWALVTDMTMGVVIPTRRATASAYQMILSHAFGDAGSPYIIGAISDAMKAKLMLDNKSKLESIYYSKQYALFLNPFISVLGGALFLWASLYIVKDKLRTAKLIEESRFHYETVGSDYQPEDSQIITSPPESLTSVKVNHIT